MTDLVRMIADAEEGAVVELPAGTHRARIVVNRSITLVGARWGEVVLDGEGGAPVIEVRAPDAEVTLRRLAFQGGGGRAGGAICVDDIGRLRIEECVMRRNTAPTDGGGALFAAAGRIVVHRSILRENHGRSGGAVLVTGSADVTLDGCLITCNSARLGGAVAVEQDGAIMLSHCTLADNVSPRGELFAAAADLIGGASVSVSRSILASARPEHALEVRAHDRCAIDLSYSLLPVGLPRDRFRDLGGNVVGEPWFLPGSYAPGPRSPSIGIVPVSPGVDVETDLLGHPRLRSGLVDAGALVHVGRARRMRRPSSRGAERRRLVPENEI